MKRYFVYITGLVIVMMFSCHRGNTMPVAFTVFSEAVIAHKDSLIEKDIPKYFSKNLDAYVGTWEYSAGAEVFRIVLKKDKEYDDYDGTYLNERIYGGHVYMRDGQVVSDCIQIVLESTTLDDSKTMSISANNVALSEEDVETNELRLGFRDRLKNKIGLGTLTLIPGAPPQLHWKIIREPEKVYILRENETIPDSDPTWSVPTDLILTKVE